MRGTVKLALIALVMLAGFGNEIWLALVVLVVLTAVAWVVR